MTRKTSRGVRMVSIAGLCSILAGSAFVRQRTAAAEGGDENNARARCAERLAISLTGENASAQVAALTDPTTAVDAMLETPAFSDRFASFINSAFNNGPADDPTGEVVYFLSKYVVENNKPWKELFTGRYDLVATPDKKGLSVIASETGLGFFRTNAWMVRYAGNESEGIRIASAYRIIQNTTDTVLTPSIGKPEEDRSEAGRKAGICKSCHYDAWYALDTAAGVLTRKLVDSKDRVSFTTAPAIGPATFVGKNVANDRDLVEALVDSETWTFAQCRFVFRFLFGRPENKCEAPLFDRCTDALEKKGTMKAAIAAVAKDPVFCL